MTPPLLRLAKQFRYRATRNCHKSYYTNHPNLRGACGVVSTAFYLKYHNLYPTLTIHEGEFANAGYHVWLKHGSNILDLTATQYRGIVLPRRTPPILYLKPLHPWWDCYCPTLTNTMTKDVLDYWSDADPYFMDALL